MKYILEKLTSSNTRVRLEFDSHSALMTHLYYMMQKEQGSSVVAVFISPL